MLTVQNRFVVMPSLMKTPTTVWCVSWRRKWLVWRTCCTPRALAISSRVSHHHVQLFIFYSCRWVPYTWIWEYNMYVCTFYKMLDSSSWNMRTWAQGVVSRKISMSEYKALKTHDPEFWGYIERYSHSNIRPPGHHVNRGLWEQRTYEQMILGGGNPKKDTVGNLGPRILKNI